MNRSYKVIVGPQSTIIISTEKGDIHLQPNTVLNIRNRNGTTLWEVRSKEGTLYTMATESVLQNWIFNSKAITYIDKEEFKVLLEEMKMTKFALMPNRDLSKAFKRRAFRDEYTGDELELEAEYPQGTRFAPLEGQLLYISWPQSRWGDDEDSWGSDLGAFKDAYAVELSDELLEACSSMLPEQGFYLEVVELDDRYRFFVKYSQILGNRWLFENFKGEPWDN